MTLTLNAETLTEATSVDVRKVSTEPATGVLRADVRNLTVLKTRNVFRLPPSSANVKKVSGSTMDLHVSISTSAQRKSAMIELTV